LVEQFPF